MGRAQFRDTVMLRGTNGLLTLVPDGALVSLYDVGTEHPISATVYADSQSATTLPNPLRISHDAEIEFWLDIERELDLVINHAGFETQRLTVTTDSAHSTADDPHPQYLTQAEGDALYLTQAEGDALYMPAGATVGVDSALRAYVQQIMQILDPSGPPPPPP